MADFADFDRLLTITVVIHPAPRAGTFRSPFLSYIGTRSGTQVVFIPFIRPVPPSGSDFLERIGRPIPQAKDMAHEVKDGMGVVMVVMWLGDCRADCGPGVVEELVLQSRGHVCDRLAILFGKVGPGGEQGAELALADLVGVVAQLLKEKAGIALVAQLRVAVRRFALNDHQCGINPFLPLKPVLLGLGSQVVDVIERDLVEVADSRVKVAGDGDIQNQRQPIPPRSLDTDILLKRDDRLSGGRGADDQVGLDQGLAKPLKRHGLAIPAGRDRAGIGQDHGW